MNLRLIETFERGVLHDKFNQNPSKVGKVKCQAIPAQAWTWPEGCRKSLLLHFKAIGT